MSLNVLRILTLDVKMKEGERKYLPENGGSIPIRKIYVNAAQNYPHYRKVEEVFSKYGAIKNIKLCTTGVFFFVTFLRREDAARVLSQHEKRHLLLQYGFKVKPADQWHQPLELANGAIVWDRRQTHNTRMLVDEEPQPWSADPSKPSLMDLDDDCLLLILRCLSLRELIGVERVCTRMRILSLATWSHVTALDFEKAFQPRLEVEIRVDHFREVLLRCGSSLTSLDISGLRMNLNLPRAVGQIVKHCPNLKELDLSKYVVKEPALLPLEPIFKQLRTLKLNSMTIESDYFLWIVDNAVSLESLEANDLPGSCAKAFLRHAGSTPPRKPVETYRMLKSSPWGHILTKLHVDSCTINLAYILVEYPNLEDLKAKDITIGLLSVDCSNLVENKLKSLTVCSYLGGYRWILKQLATLLVSLEHLSITSDRGGYPTSCDVGFEELARLKCLKRLYLTHFPLIDDDLIKIADNTTGKLEEFSCHHCEDISDSGPARLLASSPRLRLLDVSRTSVYEKEFVPEVEKSVSARTDPLPLSLVIDGQYHWSSLRHPLVKLRKVCSSECSKCAEEIFDYDDMLDTDDDDLWSEMENYYDDPEDDFDDYLNGYDSDLDFFDMILL